MIFLRVFKIDSQYFNPHRYHPRLCNRKYLHDKIQCHHVDVWSHLGVNSAHPCLDDMVPLKVKLNFGQASLSLLSGVLFKFYWFFIPGVFGSTSTSQSLLFFSSMLCGCSLYRCAVPALCGTQLTTKFLQKVTKQVKKYSHGAIIFHP